MEQLSPDEKERRQREDDRLNEEVDEAVIAGMEQDLLEATKKGQVTTEEVRQWETQILEMKERLRLSREEHRRAREEREKARSTGQVQTTE
ncbi:MAG: hypothetical protein ABFE01_06335 [Phycisphaerales bacterium]|jgi:hypothetical protein